MTTSLHKHGSVKKIILNFAITKAVLDIVCEILHAGRGAIDIGTWAKAKNIFWGGYGHVAYQIQANDACSNMVANILPTATPSTFVVGSKGQPIFF